MDALNPPLLDVVTRLHRLTPAVLAMAAGLPPGERQHLLATWRGHLRARRALIRQLVPTVVASPIARRRLAWLLGGSGARSRLGWPRRLVAPRRPHIRPWLGRR